MQIRWELDITKIQAIRVFIFNRQVSVDQIFASTSNDVVITCAGSYLIVPIPREDGVIVIFLSLAVVATEPWGCQASCAIYGEFDVPITI
ncbi:hypothetical protein F469_01995 [Pseudomonas sp. URMO17WK12:I2]|nr:hypothetical protein F469_01995 [Pseudomonas sp. URMO17WK12:I2]